MMKRLRCASSESTCGAWFVSMRKFALHGTDSHEPDGVFTSRFPVIILFIHSRNLEDGSPTSLNVMIRLPMNEYAMTAAA